MASQTGKQPRIPPLRTVIIDGDAQRFLLPDHHHQLLAPRDPRVDEVPLQEHVVLRGKRDHDRRELRSLRLVDTGSTKWQAEKLRKVSVEMHKKSSDMPKNMRLLILLRSGMQNARSNERFLPAHSGTPESFYCGAAGT